MTDKIEPIFPKSSLNLTFKVDGVFAFPDQWRVTDQANPGMFTYIVKFCNYEVLNGKIQPRELTQKQLRQQEESKKKGAKKQAKKQENPAQAQRLRQLQQKQEAEQRLREQQWNKMTQQQRFYSASQDKFKSSSLKFEKNSVQKQISGNHLVILQEHITKDGGQWVYVFKQPTANEQDLDKLKKSKPKNLNLNDLNPICMRAWIDFSSLNSNDNKNLIQRCKLIQVDSTAETTQPNLQKTYIKIDILLSEPLLAKKDQYTVANIIKNPPQPDPIPLDIKYVEQLKQQLRLGIQSLAMQYSNMFWRDLNTNQELKLSQIFVNNKKNEHLRRKQQFLYDFNVSGKYRVLKQRLKKVIVHLCESKFLDKMEENKSFTGITCSVRDQFYSQIYNFLVSNYSTTMGELIEQKKQKLNEVLVLNEKNRKIETQTHLQRYKTETTQERFERVISEYNMVGNYKYGEQMYKNGISKDPSNIRLKYQYSIFCIKNRLYPVSEIISWGYIEQYLEHNKDNKSVQKQFLLLTLASDDAKSLKKCWVIIRQLLNEQPYNIKYILIAAIIAESLGKADCSAKFINLAYRNQLRRLGRIKQEGKHRTQPLSSEIPSLSSAATYNSELKPQEKNSLWISLLEQFSGLGLFNLVERVKQRIQGQKSAVLEKQNIKILYSKRQFQQCKEKSIEYYKQNKDFQVIETIINCCHYLNKAQQKVKYLKEGLQTAPKDKKLYFYLNLGFYYLMMGKYGNAKACLTKYLDKNEYLGGLSWQILGISELKSNNYDLAIEAFRHSNFADPYNKQVWSWLAESFCSLHNFIMVNQCLNCYIDSGAMGETEKKRLKQIKDVIEKAKVNNFYDTTIKEKLIQRLEEY